MAKITDCAKFILAVSMLSAAAVSSLIAQKGIDTQTQKIKDDTNKSTARPTDASKSISWGQGKTKVRDKLANPYSLSSRRDVLVENVLEVLKDNKIIVDDAASRPRDGVIITQPYVFAKGAVITQNELNRYAVLQYGDTAWTRGQYTLTIEVQPVDGARNNVSVTAKVEGRGGNGLTAEWTTLQSSGVAEDEFLAKLVELVTGVSPDKPQDTDQ
jgi:hypothetical protein